MKISRIMLVLACFIGLTQPAWSQKAGDKAGSGIPGYLDPQTGTFRPLAQTLAAPEDTEALAAVAPTTGTLVFTITITVSSKNVGSSITCVANASVSEGTFPNAFTFTEVGSVPAPTSGSPRICTVTIPYSWPLSNRTSDVIMPDIDVFAGTSLAQPVRGHTRNLSPKPVPLSGATTSFTANVTL